MIDLDVEKLFHAIDVRRRHEVMRWDEIAAQIGTSSSALGRLGRGGAPSATLLLRALAWLGCADWREYVLEGEATCS